MSDRIFPYPDAILAHAAGFFDGEGCISLAISKTGTAHIRTSVANTNKEVIEYLQTQFGGRFFNRPNKKQSKCKDSFTWVLYGKDCIRFLKLIKPWIIIKREQISLVEHFFSIRHTQNYRPSDDYRDYIGLLKNQMNWLNRKGPRKVSDFEPIPYRTGSILAKDYYKNLTIN